jgi:tetratricopeptide (TPR) repeat protein/class 3 adenylate cyclase
MKYLYILLFLSPLFLFAQLSEQQEAKIDSLKQVINETEQDSIKFEAWIDWEDIIYRLDPDLALELNKKIEFRCKEVLGNPELPPRGKEKVMYQEALAYCLGNIGWIYNKQSDYEKAMMYYTQSLQIKEELGNKKGIASSLNNIGLIYYEQGDYSKAMAHYTQSLQIKEELGDKTGIASSLNNIGLIYYEQGDYSKAIGYYTQSLKIEEILGNKNGSASSFNNIGLIYYEQGDYAKAMANYTQSLQIHEELGDKTGIANALNNVGLIYKRQGDYSKAMANYTQSLQIKEELGDKNGIANSLKNIGLIYKSQGDNTKAMAYYTQSLKIEEELGNKTGIARSHNNIGNIYYEQGDYSKAIGYYTQSLQIKEELGDKNGIARSHNNIGNIYHDQGYYTKAINHSQRALILAQKVGNLTTINDVSESLYKSYKAIGKTDEALKMYELHITSRDSLESETNQKEVIRLEYKYAYEKEALADSIQFVQQQKVIQAELKAQKQQSYFLFTGLGLALLLGGFIFRQKRKVELEKGKSEKLLLNILPKETAVELKEKGSVAAKSYPMASVLFTDFKGFTSISEKMTPEQLLSELNYCYSEFDKIMQRNGVEKIKTIGDAYMATAGVPVKNTSHASDAVKAAIEITEFMLSYIENRRKNDQPYFEVRIGIASGPLVAGVVGTYKFQYDVWGDTVNIAQRMESNGQPGKINISKSTYQQVKEEIDYSFSLRREVDVKGKGKMEMYFVKKRYITN